MKRWYAFSGIVNRELSSVTEITGTSYEVFSQLLNNVLATFNTLTEAELFLSELDEFSRRFARIRESQATQMVPAQSRGTFLVPLVPLPIFTRPGKVLTTRGYWDVQGRAVPATNVFNFAFGAHFMPISTIFERSSATPPHADTFEVYTYRDAAPVPDPLIDDVGWFAYDSFVRIQVTPAVSQDPPFHSKTNKNFRENHALVVVGSIDLAATDLTSLSVSFGIHFRVLVVH